MRVKIFPIHSVNNAEYIINSWFEQHGEVDIVSVATMPNCNAYIILYKEMSVGNDSDEVD